MDDERSPLRLSEKNHWSVKWVFCALLCTSRVGWPQQTVRAFADLECSLSYLGYFRMSKANWHNVYVAGINRLMASSRSREASRREGTSHMPPVMRKEQSMPVPPDRFSLTRCLKIVQRQNIWYISSRLPSVSISYYIGRVKCVFLVLLSCL